MAATKKRKIGLIIVWVVLALLLAAALVTVALHTGGYTQELSPMGVAVNGKPIAGSVEGVELKPDKPLQLLVTFPVTKDADYTVMITPAKGIDFTYTVDGGEELHFADLESLLPAFTVDRGKLGTTITPPANTLELLGKLYPGGKVAVTDAGTLAEGVDWYTVTITPTIEGVDAVTIGCRSPIGALMIELDEYEVLF